MTGARNEVLIARIQKLLAMAADGSGASPNEAATAMRMATRLMADNGIEEAALRVEQGAEALDVGEACEASTGAATGTHGYRLTLQWAIAHATSCKLWWRFDVPVYIGTGTDPIVAVALYNAAMAAIESATTSYIARMPAGSRRTAASRFRMGWASAVNLAAKAQAAAKTEDRTVRSSTGTALVLVAADVAKAKANAVAVYQKANGQSYGRPRSARVVGDSSYHAGRSAGSSYALRRDLVS